MLFKTLLPVQEGLVARWTDGEHHRSSVVRGIALEDTGSLCVLVITDGALVAKLATTVRLKQELAGWSLLDDKKRVKSKDVEPCVACSTPGDLRTGQRCGVCGELGLCALCGRCTGCEPPKRAKRSQCGFGCCLG